MTDNTHFATIHQAQPQNHINGHYDYPGYIPAAHGFEHNESSSSGATSSGDGHFAFPVRHQSQSDMTGSPTSSYAPSISDGRHNSISYPNQTAFKIPAAVNQDRRTSSPAVVARNQQMMPGATFQAPIGNQHDMHNSPWTPNFSFGNPSNHDAAMQQRYVDSYANQQYLPKQSQARRGSHGFGIPQELPSQYSFDRRMSHPVLPTSSFESSPSAPRQRQISAVDWQTYAAANHMARQGIPEASQGFQGSDGLWNTLDSARGMVAMSHQQVDPLDHFRNASAASRRQSMPFLPGNGTINEDGGDLNEHSGFAVHRGVTAHSDDGIMMQPSIGADGNPDQASMMNTFSAKDTNSGHKKHVCPVCKKRFTRPSSLTTHIYSHTGEKPFICEVDGCGRHFSVISNLRRHKKIHSQTGTNGSLSASADDE